MRHQQFNIQQLYVLPTLYLCFFVFIWEQTTTCATYSINWLVFIAEMKSVYSAVRTGSLNKAVFASYIKPNGYVMHQQFNIQQLYALPHTVFVCFVFIWEQTAIISIYNSFPNIFYSRTTFGIENKNGSSVNIKAQNDRYQNFKILYLRTDFRQILIYTGSIRNNALHDLNLIKLTVARFMGTGCFFIRYTGVHMK